MNHRYYLLPSQLRPRHPQLALQSHNSSFLVIDVITDKQSS
ncbi:hypothetical protein [Vibrio gallaecicus]|nr:hypothetical protein [Vibrio gallaecicus]MDN3617043.1 hypothetical protein [Vibrio gallaecicus]